MKSYYNTDPIARGLKLSPIMYIYNSFYYNTDPIARGLKLTTRWFDTSIGDYNTDPIARGLKLNILVCNHTDTNITTLTRLLGD